MLLIAGALHVQLVLITSVRRGNWEVRLSPGWTTWERRGRSWVKLKLKRHTQTYKKWTLNTQRQINPADIHVCAKYPECMSTRNTYCSDSELLTLLSCSSHFTL